MRCTVVTRALHHGHGITTEAASCRFPAAGGDHKGEHKTPRKEAADLVIYMEQEKLAWTAIFLRYPRWLARGPTRRRGCSFPSAAEPSGVPELLASALLPLPGVPDHRPPFLKPRCLGLPPPPLRRDVLTWSLLFRELRSPFTLLLIRAPSGQVLCGLDRHPLGARLGPPRPLCLCQSLEGGRY